MSVKYMSGDRVWVRGINKYNTRKYNEWGTYMHLSDDPDEKWPHVVEMVEAGGRVRRMFSGDAVSGGFLTACREVLDESRR